ncbi:preprotein translocase subunit YajC [Sporolactobacillus terrae]|uniref:Preprotein translocase subunit YajC n=2 Tax=Sporolactobacillus terrae TaxID=269673 RepID=A0ABX5Q8D9_9BACL|nr:preprotein translocase subunit YajC [Sporolactobacillus terrae]QAA22907.1 preprotein translocase subunit YajC [Sporolactobacillus terrae]QAA25880.1 preprotein translocase subunit YajC [Sporolactobacillus terrae]UAK17754.1 preprotein translocase subunit YajC [Sporolactobacillus terrae]
MQIIFLLLFVAIFYFLLIRPQQKRTKEARQMQSSLSRGDKIVTIGGLQGTIDSLDDQTATLRCGAGKLTFERNAIRAVLKKANAPEPEKIEEGKDKKTENDTETEKK